MRRLHRAAEILKEDGIKQLINKSVWHFLPITPDLYNNKIWHRLPSIADHGTYNEVKVKGNYPVLTNKNETEIQHRILDFKTPWQTPSNVPDYKQPTVHQIKNNYEEGEEVVIIGGGHGVTAVHSAHQVGPNGNVIVYEGNREGIVAKKNS